MVEIILRRTGKQGDICETVLVSFNDADGHMGGVGSEELSFPGLSIRPKEQAVLRDGQPITLSHYEFFTLLYLAEHPGWVFSKQQIYEAVWKDPGESCGAAVTSVISQLRRKLWPEDTKGGYIRTVHNSGYKFEI